MGRIGLIVFGGWLVEVAVVGVIVLIGLLCKLMDCTLIANIDANGVCISLSTQKCSCVSVHQACEVKF